MNFIPAKPEPMAYLSIQPDAPHMASVELGMAHQTQALWYRCTGHRKAYHFLTPATAPQAQLTAASTYTRFQMYWTSTGPVNWDYHIPMTYHARATSIQASVYFATYFPAPIRLRMATDTFINAVSSVDGPDGPLTSACQRVTLPNGPWSEQVVRLGIPTFLYRCDLKTTPDIDTDRRANFFFEAQYDAPTFPYSTATIPVWIYSIELMTRMKTTAEVAP